MAAYYNGTVPGSDEAWHILNDDGLPEHRTIQDVTDGAVGTLPHLFQLEFFNAVLIGGDGGAFDTDPVLPDGVGGIYGYLVIGLVAVLYAKVKIFYVYIHVRKDELVLDKLPDNS